MRDKNLINVKYIYVSDISLQGSVCKRKVFNITCVETVNNR